MAKILINRSSEENGILAKKLENHGLEVVSFNMLNYRKHILDFDDFQEYTNIIITSKFAAKILVNEYKMDANIFVVGQNSAEILAGNPYLKIKHISQNARELKSYILQNFEKMNGNKFIYFSGNIITEEFEMAKRVILYDTEYENEMPDYVINEIQKGIDYLFLYSKKSAENLKLLLLRYNLLQKIKNSVLIALSHDIGLELKNYMSIISYPQRPYSSEMIEMLIEYESERQKQKTE